MKAVYKQFWHHFRHFPWAIVSPVFLVFVALMLFGYWQYQLANDLRQQAHNFQQLQAAGDEELASLHLLQLAGAEERQQLEAALLEATSSATQERQQTISVIYEQYKQVVDRVERNSSVKLDVSEVEDTFAEWGKLLLEQNFDKLGKSMASSISKMDSDYSSYQASLVKTAPPPPQNTSNPAGYSYQHVSTSRGSFWTKLIKLPLSQVNVRTVSAFSSDCSDNCPAKSLSQHVSDQGGFAGINGTYFCPPDYAHCAGKTNTYDFAVYNTSTGNWLNQNALGWDALIGLAVFNGGSPSFYRYPNQWGGGAVTAGITNSPGLLVHHGAIVMNDGLLDSYQKVKGVRGALGVGGGNIMLAVISGASITDAAHVMKALGASDALNLDGGGSTALYIDGQYKAGPGRLLPNAIVLTH